MGHRVEEVEDTCPKCGRHLILRDGKYGEFLGCTGFPACKYSKSLSLEEDTGLKLYHPPSPYCGKCNHTGLLPFIKNGRKVPNAFLFCECHQEEAEHFTRVRPRDIDFPISYDYYRSLCQYHGWQDPGSCDMPEPEKPLPVVVEHIYEYKRVDRKALEIDERLQGVEKVLGDHLSVKKGKQAPF